MLSRAFITGVSGLELTAAERDFIRAERPWGFILFKRNIESPAQVSALVGELNATVGMADAPVLIDQEGGRVQRLGPPHWPVYPPGASFGALYDIDPKLGLAAARLSSRLIAACKATSRRARADSLPGSPRFATCAWSVLGGEDGKGCTWIAGGKPAEGIGRTRQIGSTPWAAR